MGPVVISYIVLYFKDSSLESFPIDKVLQPGETFSQINTAIDNPEYLIVVTNDSGIPSNALE
jgi:hypothetical protein